MNDLSKSLKILVDRYPGTMAELARQAQIDRSSLYKIMDGKRMPNRAQLQRLIHALGLNARQAEHLTTQYDELRSCAQAHRTDEALYELLYFISLTHLFCTPISIRLPRELCWIWEQVRAFLVFR